LSDFTKIAFFMFFGIAFVFGSMLVVRLLSTSKYDPIKSLPYECGMDTIGPTWIQFQNNYFMYALLFLVFDVETVFLFPWAIRFSQLGLMAFIEMVLFVAMLLLALWYAWKEGVLEWS
jgi:NADH:ubiquinone oxidoreductase subunit 3 (subunit A)